MLRVNIYTSYYNISSYVCTYSYYICVCNIIKTTLCMLRSAFLRIFTFDISESDMQYSYGCTNRTFVFIFKFFFRLHSWFAIAHALHTYVRLLSFRRITETGSMHAWFDASSFSNKNLVGVSYGVYAEWFKSIVRTWCGDAPAA